MKSEREVAQSCLTLSDPMDCSPPGSSVHGISQARVLEWGAIAFSEISGYRSVKRELGQKDMGVARKEQHEKKKKEKKKDFLGSPVVKTLHFHCKGPGLDSWSGN